MADNSSDPAARRKQKVRLSYHTEEMVPVVVGLVGLTIAGKFLYTILAFLGGAGYWLYLLHQDRTRKLIGPDSGVQPNSRTYVYSTGHKVGSVLELMQLWVDAMPEGVMERYTRSKSVSFGDEDDLAQWRKSKQKMQEVGPEDEPGAEEKRGEAEDEGASKDAFQRTVSDRKDTKPILKPEASEVDLVSAERCREALEQGIGVLHALLTGTRDGAGMSRGTARRAIEDNGVQIVYATMKAHPVEVVLAGGMQILMHLASDPKKQDQVEVLKALGPAQLVELVQSGPCWNRESVVRRALQLVGTLCDAEAAQEHLGAAGAVKMVMEVLRQNETSAMVTQWGCWTLFNLCFHNAENTQLAVKNKPEGVLDRLAFVLQAYKDETTVVQQASMLLLSVAQKPEDLIEAHKKSLVAAMANISAKFPESKELKAITKELFDLLVKCNMAGYEVE